MQRFGFGKIIDIRLPRQRSQVSLLARIRFRSFLEGLVSGDPQILAQRVVIAIDAHGTRRADESAKTVIAHKVGTVASIIADARGDVHETRAGVRAGKQGTEIADDFADIQVQKAVLDVVRLYRLVHTGDG